MPIDWQLIAKEEGGQRLSAYVPVLSSGKSGVTIATGFDLGQRSAADIQRMPLSQPLKAKLLPYVGLKLQHAVVALRQQPLTITRAEAITIDRYVKQDVVARLKRAYNSAVGASSSRKQFDQLPTEAQTVIASVFFQHGNLWTETPRFWSFAIAQNWFAVVHELEHFRDQHPSRRKREAAYLRRMLTREAFAP